MKAKAKKSKPPRSTWAGVEWMRVSDLGEYMNVPASTLRLWQVQGRLPASAKLGDSPRSPRLFKRADIDTWLESLRREPR